MKYLLLTFILCCSSFAANPRIAGGLSVVLETNGTHYVTSTGSTINRSVQDRFTETRNILDFEATAGVTNDQTAYIQAAINAVTNTGGTVLIPEGEFTAGRIKLYSNVRLTGLGPLSVLKQLAGSSNLVEINYDNGGTTDPDDNVKGVVIEGLTLRGRGVADGFFEHRHLIYANAVSDLSVRHCNIEYPQGDGICIGGAVFGGSHITRSNYNITIAHNNFKGTNNNRNAISIVSGSGVHVLYNKFDGIGQVGMPGPIDFEPNWDGDTINNISVIGNTFENCLGSFGISVYTLSATNNYAYFRGCAIKDNYFEDNNTFSVGGAAIAIQTPQTIADSTAPMGIVIEGNTIRSGGCPFLFVNVKGLTYEGNTQIGGSVGLISDIADTSALVHGATFRDNKFFKSGNSFGQVAIGSSKDLIFDNNHFNTPLSGSATAFVTFYGDGVLNASSAAQFVKNTFIRGTNTSVTATVLAVNHTITDTENIYLLNRTDASLVPSVWDYENEVDTEIELSRIDFDDQMTLRSDAANTLTLRNGTNAQFIHIFNTHTDVSNYERGGLFWSDNFLKLTTSSSGTGSERGIQISPEGTLFFASGGTNNWAVQNDGDLITIADGRPDIGITGFRFGNVRLAHSLFSSNVFVLPLAYSSAWDGSTNAAARDDVYDALALRQPVDPDLTTIANDNPGNEYYFGTDISGNKGFHALPSAVTITNYATFAMSDLTTALTAAASQAFWRPPYAIRIVSIKAAVLTASSSGAISIDVNEGGVSIFSTALTIDASENDSSTAATAAVMSDTDIAAHALMTFDIDSEGTNAAGLQVTFAFIRI